MPNYEYECLNCGYRLEELQRFNEPPLSTCTRCGGRLRRLISARVGFIFKGAGFYATDYRPKGEGEKGKAETQ